MTEDLAVATVKGLDSQTFMIASAYLDITKPIPKGMLSKLTTYCRERKIPLFIGMDSNAHSTSWGESNTNDRGRTLDDWVFNQDMFMMNTGNTPTFCPINRGCQTIIDITLTNAWATPLLHRWGVALEECSFSDHRMIRFQLADIAEPLFKATRRICKADWGPFTSYLKTVGENTDWTLYDLNTKVGVLQDEMQEALDMIAPRKARKCVIKMSGGLTN